MTKARGRRQIEQRVVDIDDTPDEDPSVWTPDLEGATEERYPCDIDAKNRFHVRLISCNGQLQAFAIVHHTLYGGRWQEIARADCAHGDIHIDRTTRKGKKLKTRRVRTIRSERDVHDGFEEAWAILEEERSEHLRQWKG
jgi:hypothetical protein